MEIKEGTGTQDPQWGLSYAVGYFQLGMMREAWKQLNCLPEEWLGRAEVISLRGQILLSQGMWQKVADHSTEAMRRPLTVIRTPACKRQLSRNNC